MWWLPVVLVLLSAAPHQGAERGTGPLLELAMVGYDPIMADVLKQPDEGRKSAIFSPWQHRDPATGGIQGDVLSHFVDVEHHSHCSPSLTEAVVRSYEEYKIFSSGVLGFVTEGSATTSLGTTQFSYDAMSGYGNIQNPNDALFRDFFNQSDCEVRFVKFHCVSLTVKILPFYNPVFTPAFRSAMHMLQEAAMDSNSEYRKEVFAEFVRSYGTHFARTTQIGHAAYFGKWFATQPKTPAKEAARRQCMMDSAHVALASGGRRGCAGMRQTLFGASSGRCGEEDVELMLPDTGRVGEACNLDANENSRPVAYVLEKISALFRERMIHSHMVQSNQKRLNSSLLVGFFEERMGEHSQNVIERMQGSTRNQCLWRRSITASRTADSSEEDPSEKDPSEKDPSEEDDKTSLHVNGGIIIVGGLPSSSAKSLTLFMPSIPPFPVEGYGNSLALVGSVLYSCGGTGTKKQCWHIESGTQAAAWESFDIPWELRHHSAVVVHDEIWLFEDSKLMILNTSNTANKFRQFNLEFSFGNLICAVVHESQVYVIGVGEMKNEVWVNSNSSNPEQWERISLLLEGRSDFSCLAHNSDVLVTGGITAKTKARMSSVEAISVADGAVRKLGSLRGTRLNHKMAVIQGRPAVMGGHNGDGMTSIETYDKEDKSWQTLDLSLSEPRYYFGLVQYNS